ncbi:hypothetical protein CR513_08447, partial [Mucuna pruriens]
MILEYEGNVIEYREKFRVYMGLLRVSNPTFLRRAFVNDLKNKICVKLRLHPLKSLTKLMDMPLCDEKFGRHICKNKKLRIMLEEKEEELGVSEETTKEEDEI